MKKIKTKSIIITIILHSFIILGVGHGIGIMGIIDIASIPNLIDDYGFTLSGEFNDKIMSIGFISLIGKVFLIISIFLKPEFYKRILEIAGILLLWTSVYFLSSGNWSHNSVYEIAFWTSIPFLISSLNSIFLIFRKYQKMN
ncbi:hypothetical protein LPB03_13560 [Polaribacter vadi]|uniref:Uncharacterized protein n=1 Tax=Polaribacter vadi TaxID=1774273 RepID=A0A1B8U1Q5_9FLAO|nr:hypothetical protein [Polaribacter vadi]AOW18418.1 hypothetical protein LPB03_13560 [Polaribacter vadi]OBY65814.1 hypothetical protein LPB3_02900 [Polaribacter vadi]